MGKTRLADPTQEHGTVDLFSRAIEQAADGTTRYGAQTEKKVAIKVGEDLEREVNAHWRFEEEGQTQALPYSRALRRYLDSAGVELKDVISAFGIDNMGRISVERFLTNTGLRPLFSPVVEDGLRLGLNQVAPYWQGLISQSVPIDRLNYEYYVFDNTSAQDHNYELRQIGQGAPIPVAKVSVSNKAYVLTKLGRGIEWTDESKMAPIDLAALWFQQLGVKLGWQFHDIAIDRLLNGYFTDTSDAAPTMATATGGVIAEKDLFNAQATHLITYGYQSGVILASKTSAVNIKTMTYGSGAPVFPDGLEAKGLPPVAIARTLPDNRLIFVDTNFALVRFEAKPFGTEFDRDPKTQVEGSYGTETSLIVPMFKDARLVVTV